MAIGYLDIGFSFSIGATFVLTGRFFSYMEYTGTLHGCTFYHTKRPFIAISLPNHSSDVTTCNHLRDSYFLIYQILRKNRLSMGIRKTYGSGNKENKDSLKVPLETNGDESFSGILSRSEKVHEGNKPVLQKIQVNLYPLKKTETRKLS